MPAHMKDVDEPEHIRQLFQEWRWGDALFKCIDMCLSTFIS